ncbi:MAG: hypothetical protein QF815_01505, partial [Candidatus Peribacteraceae bacterium]|nr:hypothetical protein [Candidatus Peribacteraceae bacterium]
AQSETMTALLQQVDADWIVPLDADEFLCATGNIEEILQSTPVDTVSLLPWKTYIPTTDDNVAEQDIRLRLQHRRSEEPHQYYKILIPSACVKNATISLGSHALLNTATKKPMPSEEHPNLWLAHFPVRSEEQLRKKIVLGWESHQKNPDLQRGQGFHWEALYDRCKDPAPISTQELQDIALRYAITDSSVATPQVICDPITSLISVP